MSKQQVKVGRRLFLASAGALGALAKAGVAFGASRTGGGKIRTYYIAADEIEWDYAPSGIDQFTGKPFEGYPQTFIENGPHLVGKVFRKAAYREYTDSTFTMLKPRPPAEAYTGMLGPALRAEVGDTIRVVFKNNCYRTRCWVSRKRRAREPQRRARSGE